MQKSLAVLVMGALALSACAGGDEDPNLLNIRQPSEEGPDEFSVLPSKPLEIPEDLASLPAPTPGGSNLTDPTPEADAIAALGGNAGVLNRASTDGALVAYASRGGVASDIRSVLAAEDLEHRRRNDGKFMERLLNVNVYFDSYAAFALDAYAELERLRRLGIKTPAAPPEPVTEQ